MDRGRTIGRSGEVNQSSFRHTVTSLKGNNITKDVLGIILKVFPADSYENAGSHQYSDRHSPVAVCTVLVVNDGVSGNPWNLPNVVIPPTGPSGLDDYSEVLPKGCSKYINGEDFDINLQNNDTMDLDGAWCVVRFIGGNLNNPYVASWWPHPRNVYDSQTGGDGHPDEYGKGRALQQFQNGRGRYFRRINGIETTITPQGNILVSTHYANSDLNPNSTNTSDRGRFARTLNPDVGGSVRVNIKSSQILQLAWNPQEDGLGVHNVYDEALPQTNPQPTVPYAKSNLNNLLCTFSKDSVVIGTPSAFSVNSKKLITLVADAEMSLWSREDFNITSDRNTDLTVGVDYKLTSLTGSITAIAKEGDIALESTLGLFSITSSKNTEIISLEGDIIAASDKGNISFSSLLDASITATKDIVISSGVNTSIQADGNLTMSAPSMSISTGSLSVLPASGTVNIALGSGSEPALKGKTYVDAEGILVTALGAFASAVAAAVPAVSGAAGTFLSAIATWNATSASSLSSQVNIG